MRTGTISYGGGIHGVYQIFGDLKKKYIIQFNNKFHTRINCISYKLGQVIITFSLTTIAWIFFRSNSAKEGYIYIYRMVTRWDLWTFSQQSYYTWGLNQIEFKIAIIGILIVFLVDLIQYKKNMDVVQFLNTQTLVARWSVYLLFIMFLLIFGVYGPTVDATQFIYFQF